jgi:hypothetical protein
LRYCLILKRRGACLRAFRRIRLAPICKGLQILGYTDSKVIGSIASSGDVDAPINVKIQVKSVRPNIMNQRIYI